MLRDVNFFSLRFRQGEEAGLTECFSQAIDEDESIHYVAVRTTCQGYGLELRDSRPKRSGIVYAEVHSAHPPHVRGSGSNLLLLHAPEACLDLRNTGRLGVQWDFEWEDNRYRWTLIGGAGITLGGRGGLECRLLAEGEPDITIAQFDDKVNKATRTLGSLSFLDHNIERGLASDKKGLEICLVLGVLFFLDAWYDASTTDDVTAKNFVVGPSSNGTVLQEEMKKLELDEQKKIKKLGLDRVPNEVVIQEKHSLADIVRKARKRLLDPENLYITLTAKEPRQIKLLVQSIPEIQSLWTQLQAVWRTEMHGWQAELDREEAQAEKHPQTRRRKGTVPDHIGEREPTLLVYPVRSAGVDSAGAGGDPLKAAQSGIFKEEQYHLDHKRGLFSRAPSYVWEGPQMLSVHLSTIAMPSLQ